jgi:hypothetical protein
MKGFVQTALVHSRSPLLTLRRLGPARYCGACLMVGGTVVSALAYPVFALSTAVQLATQGLPRPERTLDIAVTAVAAVLLVAGPAGILLPALAAIRRRRLNELLPLVAVLPAYYVLAGVAALRALHDLVAAPFHWHKTEHGLARSSRAARSPPPGGPPSAPVRDRGPPDKSSPGTNDRTARFHEAV